MSTYPAPTSYEPERYVGLKLFALFAAVLIPAVMLIGLWLAISASNARDDARKAAKSATTTSQAAAPAASAASMPGMAMPTVGSVATPSYAGAAPANADALAMSHAAYPATMPLAPAGSADRGRRRDRACRGVAAAGPPKRVRRA